MADLKAVFIIMLMVNIGVMLVFSTGILGDQSPTTDKAKNTLSAYFTTDTLDTTNPNPTDLIANSSSMGDPVTEDQETSQTIFKSDSVMKMIADMLVLIFKSAFGLLYVLTAVGSPPVIVWLIGVPFTLLYILSGVMFIRGVN